MWRASLLCLALLVVGFEAASNTRRWSGAWKDKCENDYCYGGELVLCVDGDQVYGRYSDIGFLRGDIKGNTITGYWYEAGYSQYSTGGFEWNLIRDGEFTGSWWYTYQKCERFGWSSVRVVEEVPQNIDCGVLSKTGVLDGTWVSSKGSQVSLCSDEANYIHGSAKLGDSNSAIEITISGQVWEDDRIVTGSYWSADQETNGILLIVVSNVAEGLAISVDWWQVESNELALAQFSTPNIHFSDVFVRDQNSCQQNQPATGLTWEGAFRDQNRGLGSIFFCVQGDRVQGTFSELGWIEGVIDDDRMTGRWYTGGFREAFDSGDFEIFLINNGHTFQGFFEFGGVLKPWSGNRLDANSFYSSNCWSTPETGSAVGRWYYGKQGSDFLDICVLDDDSIEVSYTYGETNQGYARGFHSDSGLQSIQTVFWEKKTHGVGIYRLLDDRTLLESFWAEVEFAEDVKYDICDDNVVNFDYWGRHSVNRLKRMSPVQNRELCSRNKYLYDLKTIYSQSETSDASKFAILSILTFALLLLSI